MITLLIYALKVLKKLVESDYKNHRVQDPSRITSKQESQVKKYVKDFFDKVVAQKKALEKRKDELRAAREREGRPAESIAPIVLTDEKKETMSDGEPELELSDDEEGGKVKQESATPITPADPFINGEGGLKRKRDLESSGVGVDLVGDEATPTKRQKSETPPPPPPPPPPLAIDLPPDSSEQASMDSAMEVDDAYSHDAINRTNGHGLCHDQEAADGSPMIDDVPPPPPPPDDHISMDAFEAASDDGRDLQALSPGKDSFAQGYGIDRVRDEGLASKHFRSVRAIQVHQRT